MENQAKLRDWRRSKGWNQEAMAGKLGSGQSTYQSWESGRTPVPFDVQAKLRKLGYEGPWPQELGPKVNIGEPSPNYIIQSGEFSEKIGAANARIDWLKDALEKTLELCRDLDQRVRALERQSGQHG